MNKNVASRESILAEAKRLAFDKGISSVNIRRIAMECGISVGAIYNYYPSKADLLLDIAIDYWDAVFRRTIFSLKECDNFVDYYQQVFQHLSETMRTFKVNFLKELSSLGLEQKQRAQEAEEGYKDAFRQRIWSVLDNDRQIRNEVFTADFTKPEFIDFAIESALLALKSEKSDSSFLAAVFTKLLYEQP